MTENNQPSKNNPDESAWVECPAGEISGMVGRLSRQRKLATSAKVSAVAVALLVGAGIWQSLPATNQQAETPNGELQYGSICCEDVTQYAAAFRNGELDDEKTAQIRQHLAECPHCGPAFEKSDTEPQAATKVPADRISIATLANSRMLITGR